MTEKIQEQFEAWWNRVTPVDEYITEYEFVEAAFQAGYKLGDVDGYKQGFAEWIKTPHKGLRK